MNATKTRRSHAGRARLGSDAMRANRVTTMTAPFAVIVAIALGSRGIIILMQLHNYSKQLNASIVRNLT
jgi:hypothetical protein